MKIICIGRNYIDHAKELNNPVPAKPVFFMKPDSALVIRNRPFFYPDFSNDIHHEIEVVIKINRLGRSIAPEFASRYYSEIALGVDFTARDLQAECKKNGLPWEIAKGFDYSAPLSKFLPVEKFKDVHNLDFHLDINGQRAQTGNTSDMIFSFEQLISYVSGFVTLKTGDLIYTGTPAGVGPVKIGDRLTAYLDGTRMMDFPVK
ncbi:MAG: fumarylacetoacetate hydrolase family protein [Bacteroidales bacterium]|nr:fumarylacetoacetate hydrolase family protein [Bacteroidales bacterium]MCB9013663.1 fumarylacetoacetate hydrolase family protein [Bacteroidales bacterium]